LRCLGQWVMPMTAGDAYRVNAARFDAMAKNELNPSYSPKLRF
jgi:hypothetical protein